MKMLKITRSQQIGPQVNTTIKKPSTKYANIEIKHQFKTKMAQQTGRKKSDQGRRPANRKLRKRREDWKRSMALRRKVDDRQHQ